MRARHKPHERAQTRRSQRAGEVKPRHGGLKMAIQDRCTRNKLQIGAQSGRDVFKAIHIEAEAGAGDDVVSALGDIAGAAAQVKTNALTILFSANELMPEEHGYLVLDSLA
jgi:hypothetical protein